MVEPSTAHDPLDIERLVDLLAAGAITADEFQARLDVLVRIPDREEAARREKVARARRRWKAVL